MADGPKVQSITRNVERGGAHGSKFLVAVVGLDKGEICIDEKLIAAVPDPVAFIEAQANALIPDLDWSAVNA